jgi:glucose-1-phosphate cytidylyltransferase
MIPVPCELCQKAEGDAVKAVILAGGLGSRLSEETTLKPKPMVEVGGKPILWHIMNIYAAHGVTEFVIALGYKAEVIKEYFLNFYAINNNLTIDLSGGEAIIHDNGTPNWKVHLIDTGLPTQTGGRLKRLSAWLDDDETFMFTYGDGVANLNVAELLEFHRSHGKLATVTTVRPPARFGRIEFDGDKVMDFGVQIAGFQEKPSTGEGWINGGFFVLQREVLDYIDGDYTIWEQEPLQHLARDGQLMAYQHTGFWSPMDTLKEKNILEDLWTSGEAPWKIWHG